MALTADHGYWFKDSNGRLVDMSQSVIQTPTGYWNTQGDGQAQLTQADVDAAGGQQYGPAQQQVEQQYSAMGAGQTGLSPRALTAEEQNAVTNGTFTPPPGMGVYNTGNGQVLVPLGDNRFIAGPQTNEGYVSNWSPGHDATPEMHQGAAILALPFAAAGLAAAGAGGAGVAGAEGAGAAGAGTGIDASTGLFAGESANAGAATYGAGYGGAGAAAGGAGSGVGGGEGGATAEGDWWDNGNLYSDSGSTGGGGGAGDGGTGIDASTGQFSGETTNSGPAGSDSSSGLLQKAQDLAKQFGITPASALNYLKNAIGRGAPAVLGAIAANKQADSLSDLAKQYMDFGAPSRARYEASYAPGFTMQNDPGYTDALNQTSKASMHALSVNGNPAGSPNAWERSLQDVYEKTAYPALQNFRNQNASTGGIASFSAAAPSAATGAITAQGNVFNAIGAGANDIFSPKPSLAQTLADYKRMVGTAA